MKYQALSELSVLQSLQNKLQLEVSVTVLVDVQRELLRLRSILDPTRWQQLCQTFPDSVPARSKATIVELVMAEAFQARRSSARSPEHIIGAWEYSLPTSRSLRARKAYFTREIAETVRTCVKPRILVLGAGRLQEASEAIQSCRLHHSRFVALEADAALSTQLRSRHTSEQLEVVQGQWSDLPDLSTQLGQFDLVYSFHWLDLCNHEQAALWLTAAVKMLRSGGRLLATNAAFDSSDAGWVEAAWNWFPQHRSEEQLAQIAAELKHPAIRGHAVFRDEVGASIHLEVHGI